MFAIYNKGGLNFRSTIDNLYSLSNVDSLARARNNVQEGLPKDHSVKNKKRSFKDFLEKDATQAYKEVANIDTKEPIFHISDLMNTDVITLKSNNTIQEAFDIMEEKQIRQIPVLDNETNKIIGMVTHKVLLEYIFNDLEYAEHNAQRTLDILELREVITADPVTDIRRVAKVMVDFSLTAIPVVDKNDNIQGIVSRANILKAIANTPPLQIWG
ncbi:CBS domain-containing protein [Halarcobacter bivalviorum]|uniref:CBS domain-containing protein n=1 Tax=Halarcobacter bivalviorum TaxID=663364 RepID=UPI00100B8A11|nr:CBS domain-containing protein [Halarcobacter bivalviorum]RXK07962.1 CBS domain-containing protein [Halarcobacter bivalviorum]